MLRRLVTLGVLLGAPLWVCAAILDYATYFGGTGDDIIHAVAVDDAGNIWVAGETRSDDLPVTNAFQSARAGQTDAFLAKFDATGTKVLGGDVVTDVTSP